MTVIDFECSHNEEETSKTWMHWSVSTSVAQVECNVTVSEDLVHMCPVAASVYAILKEVAEPLSSSVILKVV